jgi:LemA protein
MSAGTILVLAAALATLLIYNRLVRMRLRVREAWSGVDVQLKRRADVVPNLVAAVQAYAAHERTLFEDVATARTALINAAAPITAIEPARALNQGISRLLAVAEAYPQLRASEQFLKLQDELFDLEEKLSYARHFYIRNALEYNTRLNSFPQILLAPLLGFRPADFFEIESGERRTVSAAVASPKA